MSEDVLAYASVLQLSRRDICTLKIKDAYSLHKVVYGLFEDVRSEEEKSRGDSSGILWVDKGGNFQSRQILMLSNRKPHQTPQFGKVCSKAISRNFVEHEYYGFKITLNPSKRSRVTGKIEPITTHEEIISWVIERARSFWGFNIDPDTIEVENNSVLQFAKGNVIVTHNVATLKGKLKVIDRGVFINSFTKGIGRGKTFGLGLLQIMPLYSK